MNVYLELCKNTPLFKTYYHFHMGSWWPSGYGQILKMVKLFVSTLVPQQMQIKFIHKLCIYQQYLRQIQKLEYLI